MHEAPTDDAAQNDMGKDATTVDEAQHHTKLDVATEAAAQNNVKRDAATVHAAQNDTVKDLATKDMALNDAVLLMRHTSRSGRRHSHQAACPHGRAPCVGQACGFSSAMAPGHPGI